jgi:hypothetical protein
MKPCCGEPPDVADLLLIARPFVGHHDDLAQLNSLGLIVVEDRDGRPTRRPAAGECRTKPRKVSLPRLTPRIEEAYDLACERVAAAEIWPRLHRWQLQQRLLAVSEPACCLAITCSKWKVEAGAANSGR